MEKAYSKLYCSYCNSYYNLSFEGKKFEIINLSCKCGEKIASTEDFATDKKLIQVPGINCSLHHMTRALFCLTCRLSLCPDCTHGHEHHSIVSLKEELDAESLMKIQNKLIKAENYLADYNENLKNQIVDQLKERIEKIEEAFENNKKINSQILEIVKQLFEQSELTTLNYQNFLNLKKNTTFNLASYPFTRELSNKAVDLLINHFNYNYILQRKDEFKEGVSRIFSMPLHKYYISSMVLLNDNEDDTRIVTSSFDCTVKVSSIQRNETVINIAVKEPITSLALINKYSNSVAGCSETNVFVWQIFYDTYHLNATFKGHIRRINSIITLPKYRFATCSDDLNINVWDSNGKSNKYDLITNLVMHEEPIDSMLLLKNQKQIISTSADMIVFWDINEYKDIKAIKIPDNSLATPAMLEENNEKVLIGYRETIKIINLKNFQEETIITNEKMGKVYDFIQLRDETILLVSEDGVYQFDPVTYQFLLSGTKFQKKDNVFIIFKLTNCLFITCSKEGNLKLYRY